MRQAITGARLFDGEQFHDGCAVIIDGPNIEAVVAEDKLPTGLAKIVLAGGLVAPGFIDVQVNGGGGALLNLNPDVDVVRRIAEAHRKFGTTGMLPTVITDRPEVTRAAIAAVRTARQKGVQGVLGIHIEGPFLDAARKGAHDPAFIRPLTAADIDMVAAADCGAIILTVAPNCVSPEQIAELTRRGVIVSLGHSDATHAQALAAVDAGARSFTHLFNAMSQMSGREPGMVGAALSSGKAYLGIIADGHHVHDETLKLALKIASQDRVMLVSDAMPPAAGGPDVFSLQGRDVHNRNGRLELADGTLAGSILTMDAAVRHCVNVLGVNVRDALRMASTVPAAYLKREAELGVIKPGALASLVHMDDQLHVQRTWIDGR